MPMDNASLKGKYGEFLSSRIIWQTEEGGWPQGLEVQHKAADTIRIRQEVEIWD